MKRIFLLPYRYVRILALIALAIFLIIEAFRQCDFNIFFMAAEGVLAGENVYTTIYQGWLHYYYSPFFALLLTPFTFLPEYVVTLLWLILNTYLFYRIWEILSDWLEMKLLPIFTQRALFWISVLATIQPIRDNLHYHQITILMVYLGVQGIDLILKKKDWQGGTLIALGINIKIMPIILFPYLLYRGHWKAAASCVLTYFVLLWLPAIFLGLEYNNFLLSEWWNSIDPSQKENTMDFSRAGFASLVTALFHSEEGETRSIFITQLSLDSIVLITNILRGCVVFLTLYFLRTLPFQKAKSNLHRLRELSYLFLVTPFLFPHQQNYAYFYIYPAVIYLIYYFYKRREKNGGFLKTDKVKLGILAGCYCMMNAELYLGAFRDFYIDIRLMTWAAIILLFVLIAVGSPPHVAAGFNPTQKKT